MKEGILKKLFLCHNCPEDYINTSGFFMDKNKDIAFMQKALELASKGSGFVNPNPLVGCVIVKNDKIIGKGYHAYFGGPHAEPEALKRKKDYSGSTMYVTLEPCNHFGKTPPCTSRIIEEKISRVVIGLKDPNPRVNGKGIAHLRRAGISVESGILRKEVLCQNEIYTKFITKKRPFCALKTAMTLDGKISTYSGDSKWISNEKSRKWAHELRHRYAAIMVGVNTVINDNPELTDRSTNKIKSNPLRIVVDSAGRTPLSSNVLDTSISQTLIAVTNKAPKEFIKIVKQKGVEVLICPEKDKKVDLNFFVKKLAARGIDSVLLEGGSTLNFSAIRDGIVDKVYSFISPKMFGGEKANTPLGGMGFEKVIDAITLSIEEIKRFDEDIMVEASIITK